MVSYLYHFKRPSMVGTKLYPLNKLKAVFPETYDGHAQKYKGREILMERNIPILNCLWNDVIHLSPINPQIILNVWDDLGFKIKGKEFETYKIPVKNLVEKNAIYFDPRPVEFNNFEFDESQFRNFILREYEELDHVSKRQIDAWKNDKKDGRNLFWFSHTTHVLYKGEIDVDGLEVILCK